MMGGWVNRWMGRAFWAFMDQGLFAISNFVLNVVLARWLSEAEYGDFSVAFTVFLLLGVVYCSLVVEPMFVMGAGRYADVFSGYMAALGDFHWKGMGWAMTLLGLICSLFYIGSGVCGSLVALSLCAPVIFHQWLMRRVCYIRMKPQVAAIGGWIYLSVMLGGIYLLKHLNWLTPVTGILMLAVASAPASAWIKWRLLAREGDPGARLPRREVWAVHWNYGKWSVASSVLGWLPGNVYMLVLPWWHGSEAAGALRAANNIGLPMGQIQATIALLVMPSLVRIRTWPGYYGKVFKITLAMSAASALYVGLVAVAGSWIYGLLYGGKFAGHAQQVWMIVLYLVPSGAMSVLTCGVRALEAPDKVFRSYIASAVVCVVAGLPMTYFAGVEGAAWGMALSAVACAVALLFQLKAITPYRAATGDESGVLGSSRA